MPTGSRVGIGLAAVVVMAAVGAGCQQTLVCDVSVLSVRTGQIAPGDALPPGSELIVTAGDFDSRQATIAPVASGAEVQLHLVPGVVQRFREYTSANVGGFMAITLNGSLVAVPQIQGEIPDGAISITLPDTEQEAIDAFATCIRGRALPEP
jgi:preprotein translocase subunit SecD